MEDLARWLGEQLDEDERIVRAVRVPHDWHQGPGDDPEWTDEEMVCMWPPEFHTPYERDKHWRGLTVDGAELAAHIALHDPARVLREIDAKRHLLKALLSEGHAALRPGGSTEVYCGADYEAGDPCDCGRDERVASYLRLLAAVYQDRPGYREEWRP